MTTSNDKPHFVVGGEYADTSFTRIAPGKILESHGPFGEKEAYDFWRSITGKTVDNALVRYTIEMKTDAELNVWYVVGGEFADSAFSRMAEGRPLEIYGPFDNKTALERWRAITGRTVDSALTRYTVEHAGEMDLRKLAGG
ncbi:MAG: DUF4170 domain-containing protein [Rhodospirillales bacterium]|nr:DUF4170 domain-containing protein [Rhodospirillales bacterium]MDK9722354.1 DUF4170 domain-containing protein [Rhodospirillales bacterium]